MFNPDFDPLLELEVAIQRINQLEANFTRLVDAHNAQGQLVKQIAQQNTELLQMMQSNQNMIKRFG